MKELAKFFWQGMVQGFWEGVADAIALWGIVIPILCVALSGCFLGLVLINFFFVKHDYSFVSWIQFAGWVTGCLLLYFIGNRMGNYTFNRGIAHFKGFLRRG